MGSRLDGHSVQRAWVQAQPHHSQCRVLLVVSSLCGCTRQPLALLRASCWAEQSECRKDWD